MSDHSTGSSGSSNNSWTLLSPEEVAMDTAGPVDDGTESIGDVPSLSEEVAGSAFEKPSDIEVLQETILSEEGNQVCQETSPELFEEGAVSGAEVDPDICAPIIHATITTSPPDNDLLGAVPFSIAMESSLFHSQEPFLQTSYEEADVPPTVEISSNRSPAAEVGTETTPGLVVEIGPASVIIGPAAEPAPKISPALELVAEIGPDKEFVNEIIPASEPVVQIGPASLPVAETGPATVLNAEIGPASVPVVEIFPASVPEDEIGPVSRPLAQIDPASVATAQIGTVSKLVAQIGPTSEPEKSPAPESSECSFSDIAAICASGVSHTSADPALEIHTGINSCPESSAPSLSSEISHPADTPYPETPASLLTDREEHNSLIDARLEESLGTDLPIEGRGEDSVLRQRHVHYPEELTQSSDDEDEEETEFKLPESKEEKAGLSMNHIIIGALVLLCLGSFFFSDDFDGSDLSDQELLEKLVEENKQISILEAQIQAQKEDLDVALKAAAEKGISAEEYARMKEELSALPNLKEELEALKARISELTQLTGEEPSQPSPPGFAEEGQSSAGSERGRWKKEELKRQQTLLEQSKIRLEGMKKPDWPRKWLRERLVEIHLRLLEQVDRMGKKDEWRRKLEAGNNWKKERSDGVRKHKDLFKKYHDEWEHKKTERKMERERRKQERSWQARPGHKHKHDHKEHHQSKDFWKVQEKKLRRNQSPPEHCHDVTACAEAEGLGRVRLSDFQDLLNFYLNKLHGLSVENKEAFHHLVAQFFNADIFSHDRMLFSEFAEDIANILEDLADVLMDDDGLEEEMEEFERVALWRFAA